MQVGNLHTCETLPGCELCNCASTLLGGTALALHRSTSEWVEPFEWVCPRCGSAYLTGELQPRCVTCGHWEGPS